MSGRQPAEKSVQDILLGPLAEWPRLEVCPECNYNLTGLPRGRACPECGWGNGHLGVVLPVWSSRGAADSGWRNTFALTLTGVGLMFICGLAGSWWMAVIFLAAIVLPVWLSRLLIPASRKLDSRLVPFEHGIQICRAKERPVYKRWTELTGVTLYSKHRRYHDLFLRPLRTLPQPRLAERVVLEGSYEAAQRVADAIQRAIEHAHHLTNDSQDSVPDCN